MHHPNNVGVITTHKSKAAASRTHFYLGAHLRTKQLRAFCAHFPESSFDHSTSQAVGDSAVTVSRDQESELMSSLKAPCKKPYSWSYLSDLWDSPSNANPITVQCKEGKWVVVWRYLQSVQVSLTVATRDGFTHRPWPRAPPFWWGPRATLPMTTQY